MRSSKSRGEQYLQCATKHVAKYACDGAFVSVKKLESIVLGELNRMTREYLDKDALAQKIQLESNLGEQKKLLSEFEKYNKKIADVSRGIKECHMDKLKGEVDMDEYNAIVRELKEDKAKYGKIVADGEKQVAEIEKRLLAGDTRRELVEQYTVITQLRREIVDVMIDRIVIGRRIAGTKIYPVEIYWNF